MRSSQLVATITAVEPAIRNRSVDALCATADLATLLAEAEALDDFRRTSPNLYHRVRALFFLYAIHRFHLPPLLLGRGAGLVPHAGHEHLLARRFSEAIGVFLEAQRTSGPSDALSSCLAAAYRELGLQTLADQVRRSVRSLRGNQWMFRIGHPGEQPLRIRPELLAPGPDGTFPVLRESTPVRMDLSHAGWSDIFFLGMDFPEGARVLNISIDLAVHGRDPCPRPPVEAWFRVIDSPVLRLTSVDLGATAEISDITEIFAFGRDYLGLLKAAVIAAGVVPPGVEGSGICLRELLEQLAGPGRGVELVSHVNGIPKGSRLAVSTNLLAGLIAVCMRATGQVTALDGGLTEPERRLVAARAILGEWLGGSGGGWQDSGGVWPAAKLIHGVVAAEGDPEFGTSRGRLLPRHQQVPIAGALQESLVLVHGGMAQNVGPILEMVTEKYLLRSEAEWEARQEAGRILDDIVAGVAAGDIRRVAAATTRNFRGPIQTIIPWATNLYTETLISEVQRRFDDRFWGFWMLGGMSGGGMGFIVDPGVKCEAQAALSEIMATAKRNLDAALPFAMEPVVYDFAVNDRGTWCELRRDGTAGLMPPGYYSLTVPDLIRSDHTRLSPTRRAELEAFGTACRNDEAFGGLVQALFDRLFPHGGGSGTAADLHTLLAELGFDDVQHERIRADLIAGRIGLAHNRLQASVTVEDVADGDVDIADSPEPDRDHLALGQDALARGEVAVVSLAAGVGSRWTQGAGVVKALHPFCRLAGRHRSFLEVHVAKARRTGRLHGMPLPHVVTTSWLTHGQIAAAGLPVVLSPGRSVGLRLVPMTRDLEFAWTELAHQRLDEQKQKLRDSQQAALAAWARQTGEGSDYTANLPHQCLHPVGHWYEIPNMLLNGTLAKLCADRPQLRWLFLHNVDTVGADVDPALLGRHIASGACLGVEVIPRRIEDRGGGLARVDGRPRLVEGLAMPDEAIEFRLRYYNTLSTWIDIDRLLELFGLSRHDLATADSGPRVTAAVRRLAGRMPTYVTLKDVKRRWGHGQEDVLPVTQFEKLWGDMTALPEVACRFFVVSRLRGQQLKDISQLDGWFRDGSAAHVERLGDWD
ncbi:MAG: UTP--glucose-1-phosphate uridylyltransferase [Planctomycetes bacterium]|nr:UTP--glucose-1-phosphate uridylyltransferase [Planctomycetota bacterium]